jgi:hypothetical protein
VRWLRTNAAQYRIDPGRIAIGAGPELEGRRRRLDLRGCCPRTARRC